MVEPENGGLQPGVPIALLAGGPIALPVVPTAPGVPPVAFIGVLPVGLVGVAPAGFVGVDPVVEPAWPPEPAACAMLMLAASNSAASGTARALIFRIVATLSALRPTKETAPRRASFRPMW
jgi:hypothetical protein